MIVLGASIGLNGMKRLPAGEFAMGSEDFYPEEAPVRRVEVEDFWIDERPVTVGQFRRFIKQTGDVAAAGRAGEQHLHAWAPPSHAGRLRGRRGVHGVGGQGAARRRCSRPAPESSGMHAGERYE
jgi:formylglycine-generating enzyme required for sulfatase activity